MKECTDFETKVIEDLFDDKNTGLVLLFSDEIELTCYIAECEENGSYKDGNGVTLIRSKEQLRQHLADGCTIYNMSEGMYEQYILTKLNNTSENVKDAYLKNNTLTLYTLIKVIPKLQHNFIEKIFKHKNLTFYNAAESFNDLAISLKCHNFGAELFNIFLEKYNDFINKAIQRDIIFNNFPDKLNLFTNKLVLGYLKDKSKSIFIDESDIKIITIHIDLNIVVNKNHEMRIPLSSLDYYLLLIRDKVKSCVGIEDIALSFKKDDDEISSVIMYFNISSECVFKKHNLEEFLESYFEFITTIQHMQEDELVSNIHAWIPSHLRSMQLELTLKDKPSINPKAKI